MFGDVLGLLLLGRIVHSTFICCFASFFASSSRVSRSVRLAFVIAFRSLFLYLWCRSMLALVGFSTCFWYSLCCRLIWRSNFGVLHLCLRGLGVFSCSSMLCWSAFWVMWRAWFVLVGCCVVMAVVAAWCRSGTMVCFCLLYLAIERVLCMEHGCLGIAVWKIV